jgi:integrase
MALLIPKGCTEFWGEFEINGRRVRLSLGVPVRGQRPATLRLPGDVIFERSRALAIAAFEDKRRELTDPQRAAARLERIHELVAGVALETLKPSDLLQNWKNARRKQEGLSEAHVENVEGVLARFELYLLERHPRVSDVRGVTSAVAEAFMHSEEERGIAGKTYNNILGTLSAVFAAASARAGLAFNSFGQIPKKSGKMVHRRPFSIDQLERILAAAKDDPIVGPVVITAVCSGMRRSDCVNLQWRMVDLEEGEMSLVAEKTGEPLFIPILIPLRACLENIPRSSTHCFPIAAAMLTKNPDGLTWRLMKVLKQAGIAAPEAGVDYGRRLKKPSLQGFHALKTSFVTLALNAGISMEIVRKVVGNTVVEVVREHYFRPDKESLKAEFNAKLPAFLSARADVDPARPINAAIDLLRAMTSENMTSSKAKVIELLERASGFMSGTGRAPAR